MNKKTLLILILLISRLSFAQENSSWIRYAAISPDGNKIAFTSKGDIYTCNVNGANLKAITFNKAHDFMPVWSNDGKKLAFASNRYGNFDIFVVEIASGKEQRLTFHSNNEYPYTFTNDDKEIIFGAQRLDAKKHRQYPTGSQPEVYQVPIVGGMVKQLWTIPAEDIKIRKDGKELIYHDKKGGENYFRKHHKSAITRDIWKYNVDSKKHTMLTTFYGEDRNPVYAPDQKTIYYLSEKSGTFNIHKFNIDNATNDTQITTFKTHPIRYLSISNTGVLCFTYNGYLYTKQANEDAKKVNVNINNANRSNIFEILPISGNISEMAVSPNGKEVAYIVRGEVFVSSVKSKASKRITNTAAEERFLSFSPDGNAIMYSSERNGKWGIYQTKKQNKNEIYFYASTILTEEKLIVNDNENYQGKYSPDGKSIAYVENRNWLNIYNIAGKSSINLLNNKDLYYMDDGDKYFEWSRDSKWLLIEFSPIMANTEVMLLAADGSKKMINLSESGYTDSNPKWANKGTQILWFSNINGLKSYATSGRTQSDVYSIFLTGESWDKSNLSKADYELEKDIEAKEKEEKEKKEKEKAEKSKKSKSKKNKEAKIDSLAVKIDWEGLKDRKKRLTAYSSDISSVVLSKDGETMYYIAQFKDNSALWSMKLREDKIEKILDLESSGGKLQWDKEMKQLFMLADGKIFLVDLEKKKNKAISTDNEMELDLAGERFQMFNHVWRRTKSMFYVSNMHNVDWDAMKENYQAKLSSIANDFEFTELLSEMLGELNVSHCGARYRYKMPNAGKTASLGIFIDYNYTGEGIKIDEIIKGGPLDKSKFKIKAGMIIKKINGLEIKKNVDFAKYLNRIEGKFTALHIIDNQSNTTYNITVKPISLGAENKLLYKRWVKQNEKDVEKLSGGKLAYVHIPSMGDSPYRNVYDRVLGKYYDKKALIVDTRFNGGGDLVGDLSMFLTGTHFMDYANETKVVGHEPVFRWTKPSVAMINEANYSDGHCFSCMYQDLKIGEMVGMPVPGTCSFAGWEMLQNGNIVWGSVPVSVKNMKGEWLENKETTPEYKIKNMPGIIDEGKDQQLEKAVEVLLKKIK